MAEDLHLPSSEVIDWTAEVLPEAQTRQFIEGVLWPAIDYLYIKDGGEGNFREVADDAEGFSDQGGFGPEAEGGTQFNIGAWSMDEPYYISDLEAGRLPQKTFTIGFLLQRRKDELNPEEFRLTEGGYHELWENVGFIFEPNEAQPIWASNSRSLRDSEEGQLLTLEKAKRNFQTRNAITRGDCLVIISALIELGVPPDTIDAMVDYEQVQARVFE